MKSKLIFIMTAVCVIGVCIGLNQIQIKTQAARIHQHRETEWQPAAAALEDGEFQTHLPIVKIRTGDQRIPGTPVSVNGNIEEYETAKNGEDTVTVSFSLIDGQKGCNRLEDTPSVKSKVKIRFRGNSSRHFHKKSYSIHMINEDGTENEQELAGMAAHDEWVLNGPFLDRTLLRNYLCLNISGEIMEYAPNVRYCELFVDDRYQGVYLLMESVSRGEGRINIPKPEKGSDVTSYIVRWDRAGKGDTELNNYTWYTFKSDVSALDVRYPGADQITEGRYLYINEDISRIEKMLYSYDLLSESKGFAEDLDLNAFADYFIINEFFRNVDAGRFSTFYYKDARGKLKPCVWDFNNACDNYIDYVWDEAGFTMKDAPWFGRLLKDERFVEAIVDRYRNLREGVLKEEYLLSYIDETVAWLGDIPEQNYERWGYVFDMSNYNGLNYLTPAERNDTSYQGAVNRLKAFIVKRGKWLDEHIDTLYQYCHESKNVNELVR